MKPSFHRLVTTVLVASTVIALPSTGCSQAPVSPDSAAADLAIKLQSVSAVEFYFISRTEEWSYTPDEVVSNSSTRAYRKCGGNCHNFMEPVLDHLRAARPIKCNPGDEDVLIRARPGVEIVYSFSGRQIRVAGNCYLNERGIRKIILGEDALIASGLTPSDSGASANNSFKPKPLRGSA